MFPVGGPNPTPASMNYTVVINSAVWGGSLLYYYLDAYKWFKGPKITLEADELTEAQEKAIREEGLDIDIAGIQGVTPVHNASVEKGSDGIHKATEA
ncbi:hypothetical protein LTS18_013650 [Coniosporium uncinatum]|uniref:Uncharacterized protein n=1 Tax=Coniosporium uncinatum TaxID=93489 RepID=A0ACC3D8V6_9PEZI|nr:hypothetical protein LTS18_013650 [Coniosporium uncinatum]